MKAGEHLSSPDCDVWREWKSVSLGLPLKEERVSKRQWKKRAPGNLAIILRAPWCLLVTRLVSGLPEIQENCWFLEDDFLDISDEPLVFGSHSFSVCLAGGVQENRNYLGYDLFPRPLVSGSHLSGVRLWSPGLWTFLGDDFWEESVFSSCWFDSGYLFTSVY